MDVRLKTPALHSQIGLSLRKRLRSRSNLLLVERDRVEGLPAGFLRRLHARDERPRLFPELLRELSYLLALRFGQIQGTQSEPGSHCRPARTSTHTLRGQAHATNHY